MTVRQSLLAQIQSGAFALMTPAQIASALHLGRREMLSIRAHLYALVRSGELLADRRERFGTAEQFGAIEGTVTGNERGFAFFSPFDGSGDLFLPAGALKGALHGDTVLAYHCAGTEDEGEVLAVLRRGLCELVGTYFRDGRAGYLIPDERRYNARVFIPAGKQNGAKNGDKAVAAVFSYRDGPAAEIKRIIGKSGELFSEENAIILAHSLRTDFPEAALKEAEKAQARPIDTAGREDLRGELIITVDGEDTRDIDDAISISRDGGVFHLGVHIADVSHYAEPFRALDREAYARGTSVYFPDRVIPMLPPALSNGICSLNEGEDRLTLSCLMSVDRKGRVVKSRIAPTVIRSRHRMTYTDVLKIFEKDGETVKRYPDLTAFLNCARELTEILKKARKARGGISLELHETKVLYADGEIAIDREPRDLAHEMIEQFMVLANETVAQYLAANKVPAVYRVHERPSPEKAAALADFLRERGIPFSYNPEKVTPADYSRVLSALGDRDPVVHRVMLRSMMKAVYSPNNIGHFGLASDCYCHFTSPIRRYPDLTVHRILKETFRSAAVARDKFESRVADVSEQSSRCERNAQDAERDVDALYICVYMQDKIGETYQASLSGVTGFALFAELSNSVEGIIPLETLPAGQYEWDERGMALRGCGASYRIGQEVKVRVTGVDFGSRRVQCELVRGEI